MANVVLKHENELTEQMIAVFRITMLVVMLVLEAHGAALGELLFIPSEVSY